MGSNATDNIGFLRCVYNVGLHPKGGAVTFSGAYAPAILLRWWATLAPQEPGVNQDVSDYRA